VESGRKIKAGDGVEYEAGTTVATKAVNAKRDGPQKKRLTTWTKKKENRGLLQKPHRYLHPPILHYRGTT
jgi:hypothetical protein